MSHDAMPLLALGLLWFSAIGCGLLAGVYFTFSGFVMAALARVDPAAGIAAMNAINRAILRSLFMPLFLATTLTSAALAVLAFLPWGGAASIAMLAGGILHPLGMFVVTMVRNVPLNNALVAADPATAEGAAAWARYVADWTRWNHVRTIASLAASVLFTIALVVG